MTKHRRLYFLAAASPSSWIIIQMFSAASSFNWYRPWSDYANGFGSATSDNYWSGLETMHQMTGVFPYRLKIQMIEAGTGTLRVVTFDQFSIGAASDDYRLTWSSMTSDAYFAPSNLDGFDIVTTHNGMTFSTYDHGTGQTCAVDWEGGWWYEDCWLLCLSNMAASCTQNGVDGIFVLGASTSNSGHNQFCCSRASMSILLP